MLQWIGDGAVRKNRQEIRDGAIPTHARVTRGFPLLPSHPDSLISLPLLSLGGRRRICPIAGEAAAADGLPLPRVGKQAPSPPSCTHRWGGLRPPISSEGSPGPSCTHRSGAQRHRRAPSSLVGCFSSPFPSFSSAAGSRVPLPKVNKP